MSELITQSELRSRLYYNSESGAFYRIGSGKLCGCNPNAEGYGRIFLNGRSYYSHRLIWLYVHGYFPLKIDHINRNRLDNRLVNLRTATHSQNSQNRGRRKRKNNLPRGVWRVASGRFVAQVVCEYKQYYLGTYDTQDEASTACKAARIELFGDFA